MTLNRRAFLQQMGLGVAGVGLVPLFPHRLAAQPEVANNLPRSAPELQGVASARILAFLDAVAKSRHEFHSFMMVRHGQVVAEGWWAPYRAELNHMMYSMSKSFTSTAVGLAVAEGKLKVDDRVVSFFPQDLPETVSENLAALRLKDLLSMSVGHPKDSTGAIQVSENWVKTFLGQPITLRPGSAFLYDSGATYMLSAIVQKVTGQTVLAYLTPRLFAPLGIAGVTWETCPRGINTGGWGLNIRTEGLAKFGQLYLQKGLWKERQLLPARWIEEATSFKIQQPIPANANRPKEKNDWLQGYCYQFWRSQHNAFRGDGAFGQFTLVLPDQDAVIAITSESPNMQGELDLVWEHLWPALKDQPLPADPNAVARLKQTLASLALNPPKSQAPPPLARQVSGKTFRVEANDLKVQGLAFNFQNTGSVFRLTDDKGENPIACGQEKWVLGETAMPGTPPKLTSGGAVKTQGRHKVAASGAWKDDHTYEMTWRFYETPHHDTVTCQFKDDEVRVTFLNSITGMNPGGKDKRPVLRGKLSA